MNIFAHLVRAVSNTDIVTLWSPSIPKISTAMREYIMPARGINKYVCSWVWS